MLSLQCEGITFCVKSLFRVKSYNLNRDVILSVCVRAVQGIAHRNKVFPQTLPNKLSLVASK